MKRYIFSIFFAIVIVGLYHFVNINLFSLDLTKRTREALFVVRNEPDIDDALLLLNIGRLEPDELAAKIDSLLITGVPRIGVNLCHFDKVPKGLIARYRENDRVIFANCDSSQPGALSQIVGDGNAVTHFKTDRSDYFELQLTGFTGRGNDWERINYGVRLDYRLKGELNNSYYWFDPDYLENKTVLLGYMGEYVTDEIYYFKNCRITPLNPYYGAEEDVLPDMYDIEITANIIRTIHHNDFINEVNQVVRVLIVLAICMINVIVLTYAKTRWIVVNLVIATVLFVLLTGAASFLLVYMFDKRYFLSLDELPLILLVTTFFTVALNISQKPFETPETSKG
ncbi:hypothetical protein KK083_06950 [Fulvivirgaceae bacterium PWU4]|uniref:CHASE2 domain-containing protein n=1 Tax=Chryseosolibacter histidini TaxID=2782349 RepID=A0AAP2DHP6_9BACT|nr:hypothetical protein [Chryseosolibacter histidini]MBT1696603.1 hypothetical protein [Chryseosolibacter histidini]